MTRWYWMVPVICGLSGAAHADARLDEIARQLAAKWATVKSMTADVQMKQQVPAANMSMTMDGKMEGMIQGPKGLYRIEGTMKMNMQQHPGAGGMDMTVDYTSICDGTTVYNITTMMGQKQVQEMPAEGNPTQMGRDPIAELREHYTLAAAADETLDGQVCWVVTGTPKAAAPSPAVPKNYRFSYRQSDGMSIRTQGLDASGSEVLLMTMKNIKLNSVVDPDRFKYRP